MVNAWRRFFNAVTITILTHGLLDKNSHKSKENPKRVQSCFFFFSCFFFGFLPCFLWDGEPSLLASSSEQLPERYQYNKRFARLIFDKICNICLVVRTTVGNFTSLPIGQRTRAFSYSLSPCFSSQVNRPQAMRGNYCTCSCSFASMNEEKMISFVKVYCHFNFFTKFLIFCCFQNEI